MIEMSILLNDIKSKTKVYTGMLLIYYVDDKE